MSDSAKKMDCYDIVSEVVNKIKNRKRMHVYVNPYTHEYEITNIPPNYEIQHIGPYVGMFMSYQTNNDEYRITKQNVFDTLTIDELYAPGKKRYGFCFICHDKGHFAKDCSQKETKENYYGFVYVNSITHEVMISRCLDRTPELVNMEYVGAFLSHCNDYNRYCLPTDKKNSRSKFPSTNVKTKTTCSVKIQTDIDQSNMKKSLVENNDKTSKQNIDDIPAEINTDEKQKSLSQEQNTEDKPEQKTSQENTTENQPEKTLSQNNKTTNTRKWWNKIPSQNDNNKTDEQEQDCFFCKTSDHQKDEICPTLVIDETKKSRKRKTKTESDIPKKKKKHN